MNGVKIILTSDGSNTLLNTKIDEPYHSIHGAIAESLHVFILQGLEYQLANTNLSSIRILEVGFGTALNALLTLNISNEQRVKVDYTALESNPIDYDLAVQLNYTSDMRFTHLKNKFLEMHRSDWNKVHSISSDYLLKKINVRLSEYETDQRFDLIFYDAFAPSKQPEMWDAIALAKIVDVMAPAAVLVTYCAKGEVKRILRSLGLTVISLPGPPGKREMIRAIKELYP